jgi:hypothetical protein
MNKVPQVAAVTRDVALAERRASLAIQGPALKPGPHPREDFSKFRRKAGVRESGSVPAFRVVKKAQDGITVDAAVSPRLGRILALSGNTSGPRLS